MPPKPTEKKINSIPNNILLPESCLAIATEDVRRFLNIHGQVVAENREVVNRGDKIIIPEGMRAEEAIEWIKRRQEMDEKVTDINWQLSCFGLDGAVALMKALKNIYGFVDIRGNTSFFGTENPPIMLDVPCGYDEHGNLMYSSATLGRIQPPLFEGGYLQCHISGGHSMYVSASVKSKFVNQITRIKTETERVLATESIYKGKAIIMDLSYVRDGRSFDVIKDAPKFIDVNKIDVDALILQDTARYDMVTSIWSRISRTEDLEKQGIPIRHGALLMGPYGTGKSLTAYTTARICANNNWSFIYLKSVTDLALALEIANIYEPCVVFAEDIDEAVSGADRTESINTILNTLDGLASKGKKVITILTTNHVEKINKAFLRAGRIDTVIHLTEMTSSQAAEFVKKSIGIKAHENVDWKAVGDAFSGLVPAFVTTGLNKAAMSALIANPAGDIDITGKITTDHLVGAAFSLKKHKELMDGEPVLSVADRLLSSVQTVHALTIGDGDFYNGTTNRLKKVQDQLDEM